MITIESIENHKHLTTAELDADLRKLITNGFGNNPNTFYGNPFLYHFQFKNLMRCHRENGETIYDIYADKDAWAKLLADTTVRNRKGPSEASNVWECFRINKGSIVMFKASTARYIYNKYGATSVLDPTAGWGGRMLGAWAQGIEYTGIDTNISMKPAYNDMIAHLETDRCKMLWGDCLQYNYADIDYNFVLTSPPYVNMEIYEHMTPWKTTESFYVDFFIPLWNKCVKHIQKPGHVCFNISPIMYEQAKQYGLPECDIEENLKQQLGQNENKKGQDKIYIWKNNE